MQLLIPPHMAGYDLTRAPGPQNHGGGVGVKYARMQQALSTLYPAERISSLEDVTADTVIVDWLWFGYQGFHTRADAIDAFIQKGIRNVMLCGSETNVLCWQPQLLTKLLKSVRWVTHNCEYQRQMYRSAGIYDSHYLCDPVPERLFYPAQKAARLIASGQVSWQKRSEAVSQLFMLLKGSGIETCYLGSATLWGDKESEVAQADRFRLERDIEQAADIFHRNVPQAEMAYWTNTAQHYVHVAYHDCSSQGMQEAALAGAVLWGLQHPICAERPVFMFDTIEELADGLIHFPTPQLSIRAEEVHTFAHKSWSMEAFERQFTRIVQGT